MLHLRRDWAGSPLPHLHLHWVRRSRPAASSRGRVHCMFHVASRMLHVAYCMLHVACRASYGAAGRSRPEASGARAQRRARWRPQPQRRRPTPTPTQRRVAGRAVWDTMPHGILVGHVAAHAREFLSVTPARRERWRTVGTDARGLGAGAGAQGKPWQEAAFACRVNARSTSKSGTPNPWQDYRYPWQDYRYP